MLEPNVTKKLKVAGAGLDGGATSNVMPDVLLSAGLLGMLAVSCWYCPDDYPGDDDCQHSNENAPDDL